jgi:hypothetical protein
MLFCAFTLVLITVSVHRNVVQKVRYKSTKYGNFHTVGTQSAARPKQHLFNKTYEIFSIYKLNMKNGFIYINILRCIGVYWAYWYTSWGVLVHWVTGGNTGYGRQYNGGGRCIGGYGVYR